MHKLIVDKLEYFHKNHKIPNILFHGSSGSGKKTIVNNFLNLIYNGNKDKIKDFVMYVNCAHGKGIKFIRDELKFFAKTHINSNGGDVFKSIVLLNADKLTIDAQSALRRCIELFSHTTRFFIIVEDKYKLLKPILSRFCELYIRKPDGYEAGNLYSHNLNATFSMQQIKQQRQDWLKKELIKNMNTTTMTQTNLTSFITKLYEKAYCGIDLITALEDPTVAPHITPEKRYELLFHFSRVRKEFRNEKIIMLFILNFAYLSSNVSLENISFM
jgi:DNA polymerase III delta prime subunit